MTKRFVKGTFVVLAILTSLSCSKPSAITRVVDDYWDKAYFNKNWQTNALGDEEWYYTFTITDTPPNTTAASIGEGHWLHPETIRFEITEKYLIGWRSFGSALSADTAFAENSDTQSKGAPAVIFPITQHLDSASNGSANRPWHER